MDSTTKVAVLGVVRHVASIFGGAEVLGDLGITGDASLDNILGAVTLLVSVGWSLWSKFSKKAPGAVVAAEKVAVEKPAS